MEASSTCSTGITESEKEETVGATQTPNWLLGVMKQVNGNEATLIIAEKTLSASDIAFKQARLSFPSFNKMSTREFLTEEERRVLDKSGKTARKQVVNAVNAVFVDPNTKKHEVGLRKRKYHFVLYDGWNTVLKGYKWFEVGQRFPVWSFRSESGKLHFALVPKENVDKNEEYGNVKALPDLGPFEDTDVVASHFDIA